MKLVQDLPEIFEEFGEKRREAFLEVKEYKDKGVPVVGMYCAYFPTELAMAVGAIPVGLCSFSNETVTAAERELPKSMCPAGLFVDTGDRYFSGSKTCRKN